jgi:FkbM family methyltransferase
MLKSIKQFIPTPLWNTARRVVHSGASIVERCTPMVQTRHYAGLTLYYNRGNSIIARLAQEPVFEKEMSMHIGNDLRACDTPVYMDIGANIGLIIANVLNEVPTTRITAFEPGPRQYELLQKTILTNKLSTQVALMSQALSDREGKIQFYTHESRDVAKDGLLDTGRGEKTVAIEVETTTLDRWWKQSGTPHVDVVKIDTEGAELLILRGATEFMQKVKPIFYLEIEPMNLRAYPYTAHDILAHLTKEGYRLASLDGTNVTTENMESLLRTNDTYRASPLR